MIRAKSSIKTFADLNSLLHRSNKVYFVRFGDGEIVSMMGRDHRNYRASEALTRELQESIKIENPNYLKAVSVNMPFEKGMSRGVFAPYRSNDRMAEFLVSNNLAGPDEEFESQIMFHYMSIFHSEKMYQFFETHIRPKKKMFVGSTPRDSAEIAYGTIDYYIPVPPKHAYDTIDSWWPQVVQNVDQVDLLIPSAGAASNVICKRLWYLDKPIHLLDIGSIIDAVDGKKTRTWIKHVGHRIERILPREFRNQSLPHRITCAIKDVRYAIRTLYR